MHLKVKSKIVIIDDEQSIREILSGILEDEGFAAVALSSAEQGLDDLADEGADLVLLDIWLEDNLDGMEALKIIKERFDIPVIMISGHANIETAVQATRDGAFDFIEKPLSYDKITLAVRNGLRFAQLARENKLLKQIKPRPSKIYGTSAAIQAVIDQIAMVAPTDGWVLIRGEHGTGKELVAQSIHSLSSSKSKPMIEVNCAAIPDELIESELFGHKKGSFTGAQTDKQGKFDQADGGILFLDEIGDMSLKTQAKILRILQEQKFERVGGSKTIEVNVRVLAATNKNLEQEIENGNFRADLFWRLNVVPILVPPLRERLEDIPILAKGLMESMVGKGLKVKYFSDDALEAMMKHSWPGNVRELRNFIERLAIMCSQEEITAQEVSMFLQPSSVAGEDTSFISPVLHVDFREAKRRFEKEYLQQKLLANDNNISKTAEQVGLERSHLHKKLKALHII